MAGRIYVTGDCHGSFSRFNIKDFRLQKDMDKEDYVIICGDFGGIWHIDAENRQEKYWLEWLENKSFTTLFIDGNHENFDRLGSFPIEIWSGGKVHRINSSVIHLMRGQVFSIAGKKIFTFGGAQSHDVQGGILETDDTIAVLRIYRIFLEAGDFICQCAMSMMQPGTGLRKRKERGQPDTTITRKTSSSMRRMQAA